MKLDHSWQSLFYVHKWKKLFQFRLPKTKQAIIILGSYTLKEVKKVLEGFNFD